MGLLALSCNSESSEPPTPAATSAATAYQRRDLLVDAAWLRERQDDPNLRLIDCSALPDYRAGHILGARHVWWQDTIEVNNSVYGMLVGRAGRDPLLRAADISPDTTVVAYDRDGGTWAARLLWMLQSDGFSGGRLLDGGLPAWTAAGGALTLDRPPQGNGGISATPNEEILAHAHDISARLGEPGLVLLDTRTAAERQETWNNKLRLGMIPGSLWLPRDAFFSPGSVPFLLAPEQLLAQIVTAGFSGAPADTEWIVYGLHGTLAALPWLALSALPVGTARVYDGSWSEWGADAELPLEALPD